jgi:uncharacterized SAM-binding protein YcdF (DUF218 family)
LPPFVMPVSRCPSAKRRSAPGRSAVLACFSVAGLCTLPDEALNAILLPPLENRFERARVTDPETIAGVIALGGGDDRLDEAGRLARRWPHVKLLVTGAGNPPDVLRTVGPGIARERIIIETAARNTYENAIYTAAILNTLQSRRGGKSDRWLLVTSANHMPRAVGAFRKAGLAVEAWAVKTGNSSARERLASARHEWLGLAWYWLAGRSSSPFPHPMETADSRRPAVARIRPYGPHTPDT